MMNVEDMTFDEAMEFDPSFAEGYAEWLAELDEDLELEEPAE